MSTRILLILLLLPSAAAGQTVRLDSTTTTPLLLSKHGFWLVDTTSSLTVEEVADRSFLPIQRTNFRVPFSDNTYWFQLTLRNTDSKQDQWYLEWQTPVAERVEFYDLQPDGTYRMEKAGTLIQGPARKYPGFAPYCVINLSAGEEKTIYIKIKSQRGHRADIILYESATWSQNRSSILVPIAFLAD